MLTNPSPLSGLHKLALSICARQRGVPTQPCALPAESSGKSSDDQENVAPAPLGQHLDASGMLSLQSGSATSPVVQDKGGPAATARACKLLLVWLWQAFRTVHIHNQVFAGHRIWAAAGPSVSLVLDCFYTCFPTVPGLGASSAMHNEVMALCWCAAAWTCCHTEALCDGHT